MIKIGLTGSIAMGKSTTAKLLSDIGLPVFDADQVVAELYAPGGKAVAAVANRFPSALLNDGIDRTRLSQALKEDDEGFQALEAIVHPFVDEARQRFFNQAEAQGHSLVILDIPLLFEANLQDLCDYVWVVSAPESLQRERALARPGMSEDKFETIKARQWPDDKKRQYADAVIDTSRGLEPVREQVQVLLNELQAS